MNLLRFASAACLAVSFAFVSSPAGAAPLAPSELPSGQSMVMPASGCHAGVRRHYVPEFGRTTSHFHRRDCRPVRAAAGPRDCHREARRHYLPQYGGSVVHRHVGSNCRVRVLRRHYGNGPGSGFCVQIGPIRYCER